MLRHGKVELALHHLRGATACRWATAADPARARRGLAANRAHLGRQLARPDRRARLHRTRRVRRSPVAVATPPNCCSAMPMPRSPRSPRATRLARSPWSVAGWGPTSPSRSPAPRAAQVHGADPRRRSRDSPVGRPGRPRRASSRCPSSGATPDPYALVELGRDLRPPDYAALFVRLALAGSDLEEPIAVAARVPARVARGRRQGTRRPRRHPRRSPRHLRRHLTSPTAVSDVRTVALIAHTVADGGMVAVCPWSRSQLIVVVAFLIMEPVTAATHRWVMHGIGEWFHRSHHRPGRKPRWERNDWFPVFFAAIVLFGLWLGFNRDGFAALVPWRSASPSTAPPTHWCTTATSTAGSIRSATAPTPTSTTSPHRIGSTISTTVRRTECSHRSCRPSCGRRRPAPSATRSPTSTRPPSPGSA